MKKIAIFVLVIFVCTAALFAEDESDWKLSGISPRVLWFGITPTGVDLSITYSGLELLDELNTYLFFKAGGGYQEKVFYHDATGAVLSDTSSLDKEYKRRTPNFQWEAALYQGLTWNERTGDNLLESFLYYRGRYDIYNYADSYGVVPYLFTDTSPFTDKDGLFGNSLMAGLCWKDLTEDSHQVQKGIYAEASVEYGPSWLGNSFFGETDYLRLNAQVKAYLPIFDLDESSEMNKLSVYAGNYFSVDYSGGGSVPIYVIQSFGGKNLRPGLGGSLRGFDSYAWDTRFKAVNNLELRVNGPAFFSPSFLPVLFTYFDAGYFYGHQISPGDFDAEQGFLCSAGGGIAINVFGVEHVRASFDFPLYGQRHDGASWYLNLDFGLHF